MGFVCGCASGTRQPWSERLPLASGSVLHGCIAAATHEQQPGGAESVPVTQPCGGTGLLVRCPSAEGHLTRLLTLHPLEIA